MTNLVALLGLRPSGSAPKVSTISPDAHDSVGSDRVEVRMAMGEALRLENLCGRQVNVILTCLQCFLDNSTHYFHLGLRRLPTTNFIGDILNSELLFS